MTATELVYFNVIGSFYDVEQPLNTGTTSQPQLQYISAFIDFIPRIPQGFSARIASLDLTPLSTTPANTALAIAPITGRTIDGILSTINPDNTAGVQLLANTAAIQAGLTAAGVTDLTYDVRFRNVTYGGSTNVLKNFSFVAPVDNSTIDITDPTLTRGEYLGP